ncbi:MAG TPA: hypothetical protein OIM45_07995 [Clostridiaceae bacterium]|nr:hypothetical protein [Clostridiaceae bacterium]
MLWIVFSTLFLVCLLSEYIQARNKTNNIVRTIFFMIIFVYHLFSIKGFYISEDINILVYPVSFWIGFFFPGIVITIIELWILFKTLNNQK